jgi:ParB/RepB/Spo0J family partition protein
MTTSPATRRDVPLALIDAGDNDRTNFEAESTLEHVASLAASIAEVGLLQVPKLRPVGDRFEIVYGECRTRACRLLGWDTIPADVVDLDDEAASDAMLIENTARAGLDPMDEARAYQKRIDRFGYTMKQVAEKAGVSWQRVLVRTRLLALVPEAQVLVSAGQLTGNAGLLMADLDANRQRIALRALADGMTTNALASLCRRMKAEQEQTSMFDAASFLQVEEYVLTAEAASKRATAAQLRALVAEMAAALTAAGTAPHLVAQASALVAA